MTKIRFKFGITMGVIVLIFLISWSNSIQIVKGLSCEPQSLNEIYQQGDLVFHGTVISKEYWPPNSSDAKIVFEIHELLKGAYDNTITLTSDEEFWGPNFGEGVSYVVFAHGGGEVTKYYSVPLCVPIFYGFSTVVETVGLLENNKNQTVGEMGSWRIYEFLTKEEAIQLEKIEEQENVRIIQERENKKVASNVMYLGIVGFFLISISGILIYYKKQKSRQTLKK